MTTIPQLAKLLLDKTQNIIVLAGAGMSAELGTPVYYEGDNASYGTTKSSYGYTALEHAFAPLWESDTESQKNYSRERWEYLLSIDVNQPNSPYKTLLDYITRTNKKYFVSTTNVDSAFLRAGYEGNRIHEVHGSSRVSQCLAFGQHHGVFATLNPAEGFTLCPVCKGDTRPNTMYFLDFDFNPSLLTEQQERYLDFIDTLNPEETTVLEIGAGETVSTLRQYSHRLRSIYGFNLIRINPQTDTVGSSSVGLPPMNFTSLRAEGDYIHIKSGVNDAFRILLDN